MPHATPSKWYISVVCEKCSHRTLLYRDLTEGKSDLGKTFVKTVCPNCKTEASRQIEHYQVPMVKRVSGELS
jgi:ribosomal protein S27E